MTKDPFAIDQAVRNALTERIYRVREACADAVDRNDGEAALNALKEMYVLLDKIPDAQLLYVGSSAESFVLPETARQMVAKWGGSCAVCEERIRQGDMMYWVRSTREMFCTRCSVKELLGG